MHLGYIIVFSALVITCLCIPHSAQKKEIKEKPGGKKKVLFQLKGKHWNTLGRILRKYTNLLSNFTDPQTARLFNLNDDYRIDIISDFLFFPAGSNSLVLPALRQSRNMGSSKSIPSFTDQLSRLITNQPKDMARLFTSDTTLVPTIEFIFPAPISFPFFDNLFNSRSFGRQKRDLHQNKKKGRTFAQLIPILNNNNLLSGLSFIVSNGATVLFIIFVIVHVISIVTGTGRAAPGRSFAGMPPVFNLGRLDDPKTLDFIYDIPKYLEYVDIGRVLDYGFDYFNIDDLECKMKTVCEAQSFIIERSETVGMIIKAVSSFSTLLDQEMINALDQGTSKGDCSLSYSSCKESLLDHIIGKASRMIRERLG